VALASLKLVDVRVWVKKEERAGYAHIHLYRVPERANSWRKYRRYKLEMSRPLAFPCNRKSMVDLGVPGIDHRRGTHAWSQCLGPFSSAYCGSSCGRHHERNRDKQTDTFIELLGGVTSVTFDGRF
jgi:hypothetical protein